MITLFDDGRMRLKVEFYQGHAYVHLKVMRWSKSVLKTMRARWPQMREAIKAMGCPLRAYYRDTNLLMPKFAKGFGFTKEIARNRGWVLLESQDA